MSYWQSFGHHCLWPPIQLPTNGPPIVYEAVAGYLWYSKFWRSHPNYRLQWNPCSFLCWHHSSQTHFHRTYPHPIRPCGSIVPRPHTKYYHRVHFPLYAEAKTAVEDDFCCVRHFVVMFHLGFDCIFEHSHLLSWQFHFSYHFSCNKKQRASQMTN